MRTIFFFPLKCKTNETSLSFAFCFLLSNYTTCRHLLHVSSYRLSQVGFSLTFPAASDSNDVSDKLLCVVVLFGFERW